MMKMNASTLYQVRPFLEQRRKTSDPLVMMTPNLMLKDFQIKWSNVRDPFHHFFKENLTPWELFKENSILK